MMTLNSPTGPGVPFSNLSATVYFKKRNSLKKNAKSLCEPRTLFKGFKQNPIKKTIDSGTMEPEVLKC